MDSRQDAKSAKVRRSEFLKRISEIRFFLAMLGESRRGACGVRQKNFALHCGNRNPGRPFTTLSPGRVEPLRAYAAYLVRHGDEPHAHATPRRLEPDQKTRSSHRKRTRRRHRGHRLRSWSVARFRRSRRVAKHESPKQPTGARSAAGSPPARSSTTGSPPRERSTKTSLRPSGRAATRAEAPSPVLHGDIRPSVADDSAA